MWLMQVLELDAEMLSLAEQLKDEQSLLVFGRGYNYATALEAALKVRYLASPSGTLTTWLFGIIMSILCNLVHWASSFGHYRRHACACDIDLRQSRHNVWH